MSRVNKYKMRMTEALCIIAKITTQARDKCYCTYYDTLGYRTKPILDYRNPILVKFLKDKN